MAIIDDRTPRLNLPIPVQTNKLRDDVVRLRESFTTLDGKVATVDDDGKILEDQLGELPFKLKLPGAIDRLVSQRLGEFVNVMDFGAIGDGTYHPLSEKFATIAEAKLQYANVADLSLTDSIDYAAIRQADYCVSQKGSTLYFPNGQFLVTKTIIRKANWCGSGSVNPWNYDGLGTAILPYGPGNPARWTDVDGSDASTYTPMIVNGRTNLSIRMMTLQCNESQGRWSAGIFCPAVRRQWISGVNIMGAWADAALRIDATWSDTNETLKALHPDVEPDNGCNEYYIDYCFMTGLRGVRIQGTRRDKSTTPFIWSPNGTSDINFSNCRLGNDGPEAERLAEGAGFWHDAVVNNTIGTGQGINFINCSIRVAAAECLHLDHSNRVMMVNTYAETTGNWSATYGQAVNSCTSNTNNVLLIADSNGHQWKFDGVLLADNSLTSWEFTRRVAKVRIDGRAALPWVYAPGSSSEAMALISRSGIFTLNYDDGTTITPLVYVGSGVLRPATAGGLNLGSTSYPMGDIKAGAITASGAIVPLTSGGSNLGTNSLKFQTSNVNRRAWSSTVYDSAGNGSPEGVVTASPGSEYRRLDGAVGTFKYQKQTGTGNTGWVAVG